MFNIIRSKAVKITLEMPFYGVRYGREVGVFTTWPDCEKQVKGYNKPKFRKFPSETEAWDFVRCTGQFAGDTPSKYASPSPTKPAYQPNRPTPAQRENVKADLGFDDWDDDPVPSASSATYQPPIKNTTLLSLKSCVNNMKRTMDQMRQYMTQAESYVEELQVGQKRSASSSHAAASPASSSNGPSRKRQKMDDYVDGASNDGEGDSGSVVYTDGACFSNGTPEAAAGIGVYWGPNNPMNLCQRLPGRQTNNRAEIHAAIRAIEQAKQMGITKLTLKTDSNFMIQSITKWIKKWKLNDWTLSTGNPVINRADFEELESVMAGINVNWVHVRGHQGIEGNEAADKLANEGARMSPV